MKKKNDKKGHKAYKHILFSYSRYQDKETYKDIY